MMYMHSMTSFNFIYVLIGRETVWISVHVVSRSAPCCIACCSSHKFVIAVIWPSQITKDMFEQRWGAAVLKEWQPNVTRVVSLYEITSKLMSALHGLTMGIVLPLSCDALPYCFQLLKLATCCRTCMCEASFWILRVFCYFSLYCFQLLQLGKARPFWGVNCRSVADWCRFGSRATVYMMSPGFADFSVALPYFHLLQLRTSCRPWHRHVGIAFVLTISLLRAKSFWIRSYRCFRGCVLPALWFVSQYQLHQLEICHEQPYHQPHCDILCQTDVHCLR